MLPINESAVMKQKLTEWISKAIVMMNETPTKTEKIVHCYETTGVLDVWSSKKNALYEEAVDKRHTLFPNLIDDSGFSNETDDTVELSGLAVRSVTLVDKESGQVTHEEAEEDEEIENRLVEHITEHAASLKEATAGEEPDEVADTGLRQCHTL